MHTPLSWPNERYTGNVRNILSRYSTPIRLAKVRSAGRIGTASAPYMRFVMEDKEVGQEGFGSQFTKPLRGGTLAG